MQLIIFPNGQGLAILYPSPKCELSLAEIGRKDVPAGVPFRIIEDTDLPPDSSQNELWEADFSTPDGVGIGPDAWFAEQAAARAARAAQEAANAAVATEEQESAE